MSAGSLGAAAYAVSSRLSALDAAAGAVVLLEVEQLALRRGQLGARPLVAARDVERDPLQHARPA